MYSDVNLDEILSIKIKYGRGLNNIDIQNGSHVAIVSYTMAEEFFGNAEKAVGKTFKIMEWETTIIGVREKTTLNEGFGADILIPELFYASVFSGYFYSEIMVLTQGNGNLDRCMQQIEEFLYQHYQAGDNARKFYSIYTLEGTINTVQLVSVALKAVMFFISGISMLIGGIGIMNIMLVSVSERRKEIGIKIALGATKESIIFQFLMESVIICCSGIAIGLGLSVMLIAIAKPIVEQLLGGVSVPMTIEHGTMVLSTVFSLTVGVVFSWGPAMKAANLKPIEAMRM